MADNITQNGIAPLRGLNYKQPNPYGRSDEVQAEFDRIDAEHKQRAAQMKAGVNTSFRPDIESRVESKQYDYGTPGYELGKSKYDKKDQLTPVESFDELEQRRAEAQPWYDKVANGLVKTTGRAATSFISGIAGAAFGVGTYLYRGATEGKWGFDDALTAAWNNPLSNAMADLDDWCNENFTNYKTLKEKQNSANGEWWANMGSLNTWMDDVLTNMGFIIGMGGAAAVTGGIGGAVAGAVRKAAPRVALAANSGNFMQRVAGGVKAAHLAEKWGQSTAKAVTMLNSSAGEAALEGLGVRREMMQEETQRINSTIDEHINSDPNVQALDQAYQQQIALMDQQFGYNRNHPQYQQYKQQLDQQYQQQRAAFAQPWEQRRQAALQELEQSANKAGNATALLNMAILVPSNFNMYGRLVDKSFHNAEKSVGRTWAKKNGYFSRVNAAGQKNVTGNIGNLTPKELFRQAQEGTKVYGSRSFAGNVAKRIGGDILSEGVYEEMGQGAASKGARFYHQYEDADNYWRARLDPNAAELAADGSHDFLSAVGNAFRETYGSSEGWYEGFIGGLTGGLFGASQIRNDWRDTRFAKRAAKDLNTVLQNDRLPNLLQHLVAQSYHAGRKEQFAANGNQSDWKTEDDEQTFALVSAFARAGRMEDLYHLAASYQEGMSDDDVKDMIDSSTRKMTVEVQRNERKQDNYNKARRSIEAVLKEGATMDGYMRARDANERATEEVAAASQAVADARRAAAESGVDSGFDWERKPISEIKNKARAKNKDKESRELARGIMAAVKAEERATRKAQKARSDYNALLASPESESVIEEALSKKAADDEAADNDTYEEYLDGPFVDNTGQGTISADDVRKDVEHNTERLQEVIDRYRKALEKTSKATRGMYSKEQEDYLTYTQFMEESSSSRAHELVQKWRGILPERFRIQIVNPERFEKKHALPKGSVQEDPERKGFYYVNTKDLTDEQFSQFMLYGLLRQQHLAWQTQDGQVNEEATARNRKSLADTAIDFIEEEMERTSRNQTIDRDELRRDFDDIEDYWNKSNAYAEAWMKAMENPESILTAKEKAMKFLKSKYDKLKTKLRQAKMSVQELGDLDDEQLKELDDYHYSIARLEKLRRRINNYLDSKAPDIYERLSTAFEGIKDPELREEIIERVRDRIEEIIESVSSLSDSGTPTDADLDSAAMMIDINDIIPKDDELWKKIDKTAQEAISSGIKTMNAILKSLSAGIKSLLKAANEFFDKLRNQTSSPALSVKSSAEAIINGVRTLLNKARYTDEDVDRLNEIKKVVEEKIRSLESSDNALAKSAIRTLKNLLKRITSTVNGLTSVNKKDTDGVNMPPRTSTPRRSGADRSNGRFSNDVAGASDSEHLQSPSYEEEQTTVNNASNSSLYMEENSSPGTNIWQSTTGEYSRRSGFTYKPYHEIVLSAIDGKSDDEVVNIPEFGKYGNNKKVSDWRRFANRSKVIYDRLKAAKAFGYIDSGKIKSGTEVGFLITKHNGETIVYIMHNGQIVSDLNHPDYGAADTDGSLHRMYEAFDKEFESSEFDDKLGGVVSKYKVKASSVFAGFPKFAGRDADGNVPTRTIASFGDDANDVTFAVNRGDITADNEGEVVVGRGKIGQPFVLIPTPGNKGLTRKRAVPVMTKPMAKDGIEMKVIVAAAMKLSKDRNRLLTLKDFFRHFLNCKDVFVTVGTKSVLIPETIKTETRNVITIDVKTRDTDNGSPITSTITIDSDSGEVISVQNPQSLRANVSHRLLTDDSVSYSYKNVVGKMRGIPSTYTEFLKQVCHTTLSDLKTHNSWITLNKLQIDDEGKSIEIDVRPVSNGSRFETTGKGIVAIREPYTGETFFVTINEDHSNGVYKIAAISRSINGKPFEYFAMTNGTQERLKPVIARAIMASNPTLEPDVPCYFNINGVVYEFTPKAKGFSEVVYAEDRQTSNKEFNKSFDKAITSIVGSVSNDANIDSIIRSWFYPGSVTREMRSAIEGAIAAIRKGDRIPEMSASVKAKILNAKRPMTSTVRKSKLVAALVNCLRKHNINVNLDPVEGQRKLDEIQRRLNSGEKAASLQQEFNVRFFIGRDGKTVYGFADDRDGIYLDPDIVTPNALIHEYTHLWTHLLMKSSDPKHRQMWEELKAELKSLPMWETVKSNYTWLKTDDQIADEVFARISGVDGEQWFMNKIGSKLDSTVDADAVLNRLRNLLEKLLKFVKGIFGVPVSAKSMKELVWQDMLSDNPLGNFGIQEEMSTEQELEIAKEEPSSNERRLADIMDQSYDEEDIVDILESMGVSVITKDDGLYIDTSNLPSGASDYLPGLDSPSMMIELSDASDSVYFSRMVSIKMRNPLFTGVSSVLAEAQSWKERGYINGDAFLAVAEVLLSDEKINAMWNAAKQYQITRGMEPSQIAAVMYGAFNRYMQNGTTGSDVLDASFSDLLSTVDSVSNSVDTIADNERMLSVDSTSAPSRSNPISTMSTDDRKKFKQLALDSLTQRDVGYLQEAGYSKEFYLAQSSDIKEWMRECVL